MEKTNDIIKPQKFRCNKFNKKDTQNISFLDDTEDDSHFNRNSWYKKQTNIINYLHLIIVNSLFQISMGFELFFNLKLIIMTLGRLKSMSIINIIPHLQ